MVGWVKHGSSRSMVRCGTGAEQLNVYRGVRLRDHGYMVPEPTIFPSVRSTHPTVYE